MEVESLELARERIRTASRIAVLTGAGISAESGVPTFRGAGGLWQNFRLEELATPEAYQKDPLKVWEWYAWRYRKVREVSPNRAHLLLAGLEARIAATIVAADESSFLLVTQNVDDLHARAGSRLLVELHGNITRARCESCQHRFSLPEPDSFAPPPFCSECGSRARPDVVWFGETLPQGAFERALEAFSSCQAALVVGTSAQVEPAASLGRVALRAGAYLVEVNPEETPLSALAHLSLRMGAAEGLETISPHGLSEALGLGHGGPYRTRSA